MIKVIKNISLLFVIKFDLEKIIKKKRYTFTNKAKYTVTNGAYSSCTKEAKTVAILGHKLK